MGVFGEKSQTGSRSFKQFQLSSLSTGFLIFISAGMGLAQSAGWSDHHVPVQHLHFYYSWLIAVIMGALLSLPLRNILPRKFLMGISSVFILAGGIIFVSLSHNVDALIASRYLNGVAIGLMTVPYLMHASEISPDNCRGLATGLEQFAVTVGMAIQTIASSQWNAKSCFTVNCFHGIMDTILAVLSLASLYYFIESPVDFLRFGDDAAALDCLAALQRPQGATMATHRRLVELKDYVLEHSNLSIMESLKRSSLPLVKMILYRSTILAFTSSMVLTVVANIAVRVNGATWSPVLGALLHIFGSCLTLAVVDKLGRKIPSIIWILCMGALLMPAAVIMGYLENVLNVAKMRTITSIWLSIQLFAGLFAANTSTYVSEAFPLRTKSYCMTLCVIVEQIIRIIIIARADYYGSDISLMAMSIIAMIAGACLLVMLPETRKTTLKEAQDRFISLFNFS
uniref:Major facilitator superfamily (MFS) profile domain-containing protein n=1 Tax=Stomoxys calcitrans TaxID=35570 RepID=A0A1I8PAW8_STOCA